MNYNKKSHIINVTRKPLKCPVCGSPIIDIIYGTGDMTEVDFVLEYRKEGIMGGDNIPRRPPIWSCSCGCRRFRKVNPDGSDAIVKVKLLKNVRKAAARTISWTSPLASQALKEYNGNLFHSYLVEVTTDLEEMETLKITAVSSSDAKDHAVELVNSGLVGLHGRLCTATKVLKIE